MNFTAALLLVLLVLLILFNKSCVIDSYTINAADIATNVNMSSSETYTWPCDGCTTTTMLKPRFKYNISDNRCLSNKLKDYTTPITTLTNIINYKIEPDPNIFESCSATSNTMYSIANGRYLTMNNSVYFTIGSLKVYYNSIEISPTNFITYTDEGNYLEPGLLGGIWPSSKFMQIDFGSNINIDTLVITHNSQADANAFVNTILTIAVDTGSFDNASVIFLQAIKNNSLTKVIHTQYSVKTSFNIIIKKAYAWPCTTCLTYTGKLRRTNEYTVTDGRCFKAKNYIMPSFLTSAINNTISSYDLNNSFMSCAATETRFKNPITDAFVWFDATERNTVKNQLGNNAIKYEKVAQWIDKIGGIILSQSLDTLQPTYNDSTAINNNAGIYFITSRLQNSTLLLGTNSFTIISVHYGRGGPIWDLSYLTAYEKYYPNAVNSLFNLANSSSNWVMGPELNSSLPIISIIRYKQNPATLTFVSYNRSKGKEVLLNEVSYTDDFTFKGGFSVGLRIGTGSGFVGAIGDIIIIKRSILDEEIDPILGYLRYKWGI